MDLDHVIYEVADADRGHHPEPARGRQRPEPQGARGARRCLAGRRPPTPR